MYGVDAIARLELVRTLRELDTDLAEIRRLIEGGTTPHALLTTHLEIVEHQERTLRAGLAVLRTLVEQGGETVRADLMHKLVSMTDEEREQAVDDFWNEVGEGLDVPEGFVGRLREMRTVLPADPTAAQLEAWIELAGLVSGPAFRDAVRAYLREAYSAPEARTLATEPFQDFVHVSGVPLVEDLLAAHRAGESPAPPGPSGPPHGPWRRPPRCPHNAHPRGPGPDGQGMPPAPRPPAAGRRGGPRLRPLRLDRRGHALRGTVAPLTTAVLAVDRADGHAEQWAIRPCSSRTATTGRRRLPVASMAAPRNPFTGAPHVPTQTADCQSSGDSHGIGIFFRAP